MIFFVFSSRSIKMQKNNKANIQLSWPKKTCSVKNFFFLAEPMWGIPSRQDGPAEIANENTGFGLSYLLADSAIKYREILHTSTLFSQFLIFLFRDCTTVMKPTASDVEAPSIVCCSISVRAWEGIKTLYKSGEDPGFFLGGGALVSCSTSTPINHIVFFFAGYQLY